MRALAVMLVLVGCTEEHYEKTKELDAASFRTILQCAAKRDEPRCESLREEWLMIERVRVEPTDKGSARYVLTMKNTATKTVVFAEYPGKILDEMTATGIPYSVKPR